MKVSGFTFIKNGSMLGYPFVQSIRSALPICDEFIVAIGESQDDTLQKLLGINDPKIRIIETTWNDKMADRGYVYGQQKMIAQFNCTGDWAFYLEGDELLHEKELETILNVMRLHLNDTRVEAIAFDYYHFYGTVEWVTKAGYRQAPRIIRNTIRSIAPDGLFFVVIDKNKEGRYPRAALAGAHIYHYGNVRSAACMNEKIKQVAKYWGGEPVVFQYEQVDPQELVRFSGTHPALIGDWLEMEAEKQFIPNPNHIPNAKQRKHRVRFFLEELLGVDLTKKHFRLVK